jgi:hypothetical protein
MRKKLRRKYSKVWTVVMVIIDLDLLVSMINDNVGDLAKGVRVA